MQLDPGSVAVIVVIAIVIGIMLSDERNSVPWLALGLIVAFFLTYFMTGGDTYIIWNELGFKTYRIDDLSQYYTIVTSSFLHKDIVHLLSNVIFLILIGIPMKKRMSNIMFFVFIVFGDFVGKILYAVTVSSPQILIGSSIFVSSLIGAMIVMYPRLNIIMPRPIGDTKLEVWMVCLVWAILQVMQAFTAGTSDIAYLGHVYGFVAGAFIGLISKFRPMGFTLARPSENYLDVTKLEPLCVTDKQKALYEKAISNDDPEFRDAWARYLIRYIPCPKCGGKFRLVKSFFVCPNGHIIGEVGRVQTIFSPRGGGEEGSRNGKV